MAKRKAAAGMIERLNVSSAHKTNSKFQPMPFFSMCVVECYHRTCRAGSSSRQHECVAALVPAMADPAKEPGNWTEHTHSDGRRYYYNKDRAGVSSLGMCKSAKEVSNEPVAQVTKQSSWDKPECLKNADEKLNTTSWKEWLVLCSSVAVKRLSVFLYNLQVTAGLFWLCCSQGTRLLMDGITITIPSPSRVCAAKNIECAS